MTTTETKTCDYAACTTPVATAAGGWSFCSVHAAMERLHRAPARTPAPQTVNRGPITELPVRVLTEHPDNVRSDLGDLDDMVASVKAQGILQPLLVTHSEDRGRYVVIAGHRRLAAALIAELQRVPVVVRSGLDGTSAIEAMLVENLQRADLDPIDEARAYQDLIDTGRTRREIARAVGKSEAHLSSRLALLNLTKGELEAFRRGGLTLTEAYQAGRTRSKRALPAGQKRGKPRKVPHFVITHPQAEAAASSCEHETTLKLGVACGPCWEQAIREDERRRLEHGRARVADDSEPAPADPPPTPSREVDEVAVLRACDGDQSVRLTIAERREAVRALHRRGLYDRAIAATLGITDRTVLRIRQELDLPANVGAA